MPREVFHLAHRLTSTHYLGLALLLVTTAAPGQVWQTGELVLYSRHPQVGDRFGLAVSPWSTDSLGRRVLAVGAPSYDLGMGVDNGAMQSWVPTGERDFQPATQLFGSAGAGLARTLTVGNFEDDPDDANLVIGMPTASDSGVARAGMVRVLGVVDLSLSVLGQEVSAAQFGSALAVGDFNGDGHDDLAIGAAEEHTGASLLSGRVHVLYGDGIELVLATHQAFDPPPGVEAFKSRFGSALAAGDFDGDGDDDLAIGAPSRDVDLEDDELPARQSAGEVVILNGSIGGLVSGNLLRLTNASFPNLTLEAGDRFGEALAAGDFDGPGFFSCMLLGCADDLAIGSPGEDITLDADTTIDDAGIVVVVFGVKPAGLGTADAQVLRQDELGYTLEPLDQFGSVLVSGDLDGGDVPGFVRAADDLVVGVPDEDVGTVVDAGAAFLLFGSWQHGGLLPGVRVQQAYPEYGSWPPATDRRWGSSLALGDFDGDGNTDLAVGIPGLSDGPHLGAVQVIFLGVFADGFERAGTTSWAP